MKTLDALIEMCSVFRALPDAEQQKHMAAYGRANLAIAREMDRQACIKLVAETPSFEDIYDAYGAGKAKANAEFLAMRMRLQDERMGAPI